jgi:GAF domain-containing protein
MDGRPVIFRTTAPFGRGVVDERRGSWEPAPGGRVKANDHPDEARRLEVLRLYRVLDTAAEDVFDELTELAAGICGTPIAMISLVDEHRQWFKARVGMGPSETPRDVAFCAHAILEASVFTVPDATQDARFAANPLVTEDPRVRFYAGTPLVVEEGLPLGMLCVMDRKPRALTAAQEDALRRLGRVVTRLLELRRRAADLRDLEALVAMCASCRRVRDDDGRWEPLEAYVLAREPVSHGLCPDCMKRDFPEQFAKLFPAG